MGRRAPRVGLSMLAGELIALGGAQKLSGVDEGGESFVEGGVAHAAEGAQFFNGQRTRGVLKRGGDAFVEGALRSCWIRRRLCQVKGQCLAACLQFEWHAGR